MIDFFFFILITCLYDIVPIQYGEILSWSLAGVVELNCTSLGRIISSLAVHPLVKLKFISLITKDLREDITHQGNKCCSKLNSQFYTTRKKLSN